MCNVLPAPFLFPMMISTRTLRLMSISDEYNVSSLAEQYCVSREVILRKFYDRKLVSRQFYEQKVEEWKKAKSQERARAETIIAQKVSYLGESYIELVFSRLYQNRISVEQLADYLGVKVKNIPGMEELLFTKGAAHDLCF